MSTEISLTGVGLQLTRRRRKRQRGRLREMRANAVMKSFWALRGIDLNVTAGESLAVIGPARSGRTSLLRVIAGTLIPDEGDVRVAHPVVPMIDTRRMLVPAFTIRQNIHVLGGLVGLSREQIVERIPSIVEFAGLAGSIDRHLSAVPAVKSRLAFATLTSIDYPIVLIDDALTVGGRDFEQQCLSRLAEMREQGRTFVVTSDTGRELKAFCDRAVYLRDGMIQDQGSVDDMLRRMRGERRG